jgi:hypothetical protein
MNARHCLSQLLLALLSSGCAIAASSDNGLVYIQPATACRIAIAPSEGLAVRRIDDARAQITWRTAGKSGPSTEARFACSNEALPDQLNAAGFEKQGDRWVYPGGSGGGDVTEIRRPTWTGKGATYFSGGVCRVVVGQSSSGRSTIFIDFCLDEADYRRGRPNLDLLEAQVSIEDVK